MGWTSVLAESELPTGSRQVVTVDGKAILMLNHEGTIYAVDNTCPHMKLPLKKGKITDDNAIVCPWHRSAFDLCSGEPKEWTPWPPGIGKVMGMISNEKALPTFSTRTEEGQIWIDI